MLPSPAQQGLLGHSEHYTSVPLFLFASHVLPVFFHLILGCVCGDWVCVASETMPFLSFIHSFTFNYATRSRPYFRKVVRFIKGLSSLIRGNLVRNWEDELTKLRAFAVLTDDPSLVHSMGVVVHTLCNFTQVV